MIKKSFVTLTLLCSLLPAAIAAETKSKRTSRPAMTETQTLSASAPTYGSGSTGGFGLGYAATTGVFGDSAMTALINLNSGDMIQLLFSLPQTQGSLSIGFGGIYKHSMSERQGAGFHLGGGLGLGSVQGNFALSIAAVAGLHFALPGTSAVQIHLDGGPSFTLVDSAAGSASNFSIKGLSPALGLSIFYIF